MPYALHTTVQPQASMGTLCVLMGTLVSAAPEHRGVWEAIGQ